MLEVVPRLFFPHFLHCFEPNGLRHNQPEAAVATRQGQSVSVRKWREVRRSRPKEHLLLKGAFQFKRHFWPTESHVGTRQRHTKVLT